MSFAEKDLASAFQQVRSQTEAIVLPLEIEDYQVQPMVDASPPKWHLAHVSWFFETFLLKPFAPNYRPFHDAFEVLFNSYYNGVGAQYPRNKRGLLSRPTVRDVMTYRQHVDQAMVELLSQRPTPELSFRLELGLHHEQQHQELLFTDIKYNLGHNPLFPAYAGVDQSSSKAISRPMDFVAIEGGIHQIGQAPTSRQEARQFSFDNESPRHSVLIADFEIADRLVTNEAFLAFIEDGSYQRPELWLSDAWSALQASDHKHPLYWHKLDGQWFEYTLSGMAPVNLHAPVCHVSGYEADAFARWAQARLPTEQEWETAALKLAPHLRGNLGASGTWHPEVAEPTNFQFFGDAWEWTSSSYGPYPGFKPFLGQLGEYNGKFMANQLVLRGGSCVTPLNHIRHSYRNFFYPGDRWQFSGIRLARDVE